MELAAATGRLRHRASDVATPSVTDEYKNAARGGPGSPMRAFGKVCQTRSVSCILLASRTTISEILKSRISHLEPGNLKPVRFFVTVKFEKARRIEIRRF
jgi:hypothetical protein